MCGIAGIINRDGSPVDADLLTRMRDAIAYRGPDDAGIWVDGPVGLAHRRLSILDLSASGHQPMWSDDRRSAIVFNGEIFNFIELRDQLIARGFAFHTESDTEVLLRLWDSEGTASLDRLVGMFGLAIWDTRDQRLFAARDRVGIKPFYYATVGASFIFASELKAMLVHPGIGARLDTQALADLCYVGYTLDDRTLFAGIRALPPGHCLDLVGGEVTVRRYWSVHHHYDRTRSFDDTVAALSPLLDDAVRMHCRSDAPIGAHLSGGLDSSAVASIAAQYRKGLETFSIRFEGHAAYDESEFARAVAKDIGSTHWEDTPTPVALEDLLAFLTYHVEVPVTPTAIAYFGAARLARQHVTAVLTGHGGDEVFGGYPAQFEVGFGVHGDPSRVPNAAAGRSLTQRLRFVLATEGVGGVASRLRRQRQPAATLLPVDDWIARHCTLPEPAVHPSLSARTRESLQGYSPRHAFLSAFDGTDTEELFDRCLHHDMSTYLPSLLHVEDRTSMAMSLESRVPLLDHRLIEFMATVPPETKSPSRRSKELLRTVMRDKLPSMILERKDKGAFPVPVTDWMQAPNSAFIREILLSDRTLARGVYSADWIRQSVRDSTNVFPMLAFELWARIFLDRDEALIARAQRFGAEVRNHIRRV